MKFNRIRRRLNLAVIVLSVGSVTGCGDTCGFLSGSDSGSAPPIKISGVTSVQAVYRQNVAWDQSTESIPLEQLSFDVTLSTAAAAVGWTWPDWSFIRSAHACSPPEPVVTSEVVRMDLNSSATMGDLYPASTTLATLFTANTSGFGSGRVLASYSAEQPEDGAVSYSVNPVPESVNSLVPATSEPHRFVFTIELKTGEIFSGESNPIMIE